MTKTHMLIVGLLFSTTATIAQDVGRSRLLAATYVSGSLEQAQENLIATNSIPADRMVEYKAGQSVVLDPGFETKLGSVFTAHIGAILTITQSKEEFNLFSITAYPNPFADVTTIVYVLDKPARISVHISDASGRIISQLVNNQYQEAGRYQVNWRGGVIATGVYVCTLETDQQRVSNRIIRY